MFKLDVVDRIRAKWRKQKPEWDTSPIDVWDRLMLLARHYDDLLTKVISTYDVSMGGLDVLATLLRSGVPYCLTPTDLRQELLLSSGAMTHRLDRLEEKGLIVRTPNPDDRRGYHIQLSDEGLTMVEDALVAQYDEGRRLLRSLNESEEAQFITLLRSLQVSLDEEDSRISRQRDTAAQKP